jgi:tetratricopeptide (TPR) repeat protein
VIAKKPTPYIASFRYAQLGGAFMFSARFVEALEPFNEAIRLRRELKMPNELQMDLLSRASVLSALGRFEEALTDAREALAIVEQIRKTLLPTDFLKRGTTSG